MNWNAFIALHAVPALLLIGAALCFKTVRVETSRFVDRTMRGGQQGGWNAVVALSVLALLIYLPGLVGWHAHEWALRIARPHVVGMRYELGSGLPQLRLDNWRPVSAEALQKMERDLDRVCYAPVFKDLCAEARSDAQWRAAAEPWIAYRAKKGLPTSNDDARAIYLNKGVFRPVIERYEAVDAAMAGKPIRHTGITDEGLGMLRWINAILWVLAIYFWFIRILFLALGIAGLGLILGVLAAIVMAAGLLISALWGAFSG